MPVESYTDAKSIDITVRPICYTNDLLYELILAMHRGPVTSDGRQTLIRSQGDRQMNTHSSCCGGTTTGTSTACACDTAIAELPRYYPRQLITPDDLTLEQDYFRDRMRRHNRLLHGCGVVCGALVCPASTTDTNGVVSLSPWQVIVQPGYMLGPYGDEIILDCIAHSGLAHQRCFRRRPATRAADVPDPWCSQVTVPRVTGTLYIAMQYQRSMMRPVRVQPIGCGCDDNTCECSRWHDGYQIGILHMLSGRQTRRRPRATISSKATSRPVLIARSQPWVVLAAVQVDADGNITSIDNCACRRLVASLSGFWWQCKESDITVTKVDPATAFIGKPSNLKVSGTNLDKEDTYSFGNGIMVKPTASAADGTSVNLSITVDSSVQPGSRTLVIMDKHCRTVHVSQYHQSYSGALHHGRRERPGCSAGAAKQRPH